MLVFGFGFRFGFGFGFAKVGIADLPFWPNFPYPYLFPYPYPYPYLPCWPNFCLRNEPNIFSESV